MLRTKRLLDGRSGRITMRTHARRVVGARLHARRLRTAPVMRADCGVRHANPLGLRRLRRSSMGPVDLVIT